MKRLMTQREAEEYAARSNSWHCPECGIMGGLYHAASCRWLVSNAAPDHSTTDGAGNE